MSQNSKIWTIIKHEYFIKVKSRGFIIGTFVGPLAFAVFFGIIALVSIFDDDSDKKLAILDSTGFIAKELVADKPDKFYISNEPKDSLMKKVQHEEIDGFIDIPANVIDSSNVTAFTSGGGGLAFLVELENSLDNILRNHRLKSAGLDSTVIQLVEKSVNVKTQKITKEGETKDDNIAGLAAIGYILGLVVYFLTFIYGSFVSRGVVEEKANRIVEVLASSVRPFELMLGKVVGIGFVGLTQVSVWIILAFTLFAASGTIVSTFGIELNPQEVSQVVQNTNSPMNMTNPPVNPESNEQVAQIVNFVKDISPWLGVAFVFYFLAGYFIYATLFAAIGSAVDTEQDAAQLQLPLTMPIILTIMLMPKVIASPDSGMSIFLSLFPLSSPIIMMVRVAANSVSVWEVVASGLILILSFFAVLWIAGRVYRIGILMTGKKPKFTDLIKWIRL